MLILALDTTTRAGSAAVVRDGQVLHEATGDAGVTHAERLPGDLQRVLDAAGVTIGEIDLLAVAAGPGSFTGLRVGIATVQGLAMAMGRKVVAVSVLEALARAGADTVHTVAAWMDAQRGQVFASLYTADNRPIAAPTALSPGETLDNWRALADLRHVRFIGDGAWRYRDEIAERLGVEPAVLPHPSLAGVIGRIGGEVPERAVLPHAIVPVYIRRPDAELARDRQRASR